MPHITTAASSKVGQVQLPPTVTTVSARTVGSVAWARKISLSAGRHLSYVKDKNSGHLRPATNDFDEVPARRRLARPPTPDAEDTPEDEVAADINAINDEDTEDDMAPVARSSLAILSQTDEEEEDDDELLWPMMRSWSIGVGARAKHRAPTSKRYLVV
ncbi:hypothetical protein D6D21_08644 [Aureobasidium pullulans]|uniref:Uncharacterized protein n=1 Tax=Aureobasidium pullulans TaxID=5580 RepID=A0AB74IQ10_AURPU|nr:hypothetical protein D6D21_08644 [Aureobasidium pullulans]